ncbi:S9 family peptidase [soil metagenome]
MFVTAAAALLISMQGSAVQGAAVPPTLHSYAGVVLDPAGRRIASVDSAQVPGGAGTHGVLTVRGIDGRVQATVDPCGTCRYSGAAWSPDGSKLAFLASGAADGGVALYVSEGGTARVAATIKGLVSTPRWSPDGTSIALLVTLNPSKETGATQAGARQVGELGELSLDSQRIAVVPASGGEPAMISPDGTFVYEYDWTPDGASFVATAAEGNGDNNWWVASLRAFPVSGSPRVIAAPAYQMNMPRVSPDGKTVAFVGGVMSDFGSVGGDLYTVPIEGGTPTDVTPGYRGTFTSVDWRGTKLAATLLAGAEMGTAMIDPVSKTVTGVATAPVSISAGDGKASMDAAGRTVAYVTETFERAPRIEVGAPGHMRAITHDNDGLAATVSAHSISYASEGQTVQGWVLQPRELTPGAKYPMIVEVHGGPSAATTPRFVFGGTIADLVGAGYFMFLPNPRGSYGQGDAFERLNYQDFGGGDLKDILAGVDAIEASSPVDDKRLGVFGHSYGGFMTMWTVTHSDRFAAAVAGAGIANWGSYYGQNGIDKWMTPFFGSTFYDDPTVYDRLSPIRAIKAAKTPTFIYVGERDLETPAPQSMEFWHGLVADGTPTSLVIYQDEGHGIRQPAHTTDLTNRIVGWFDRYLKPQG